MNTEKTAPDHPFEHIALSLSGGGVRAVGYHLGTLDYLDRTGLLPQVHTLSSVSGGSLIGIGYALSLKKGENFQEFYDNICEFLPELNTLEDLLTVLERREPPVASGSRTLITALAIVYREKYLAKYYDDPKFGIFWKEEPDIHLKEIIFNATEFKTGFAFRFQKGHFGNSNGNAHVRLDEEYAVEVRMSDIMAASSCIPGGMEPLMFPQDFHWDGDEWHSGGKSKRPVCEKVEDSLRKNCEGTSSVPLMDGGVYDNQGITSIILALARRFRGQKPVDDDTFYDEMSSLEPIRPRDWARWLLGNMENASDNQKQKDMGDVDLFIVSDTPSLRDPMYAAEPVSSASKRGIKGWLRRRTLGQVNTVIWVTTFLLIMSIYTTFQVPEIKETSLMILFWVVRVFLVLLVAGTVRFVFYLRAKGKQMVERAAEEMPPMKRTLESYARRLRLGQIFDMATLRATSMSALTTRIFMNRIRQLGYSLLYSHEEFERRVMDNNINDINSLTAGENSEVPDFVRAPSDGVQAVVGRAASMGTKLWIDKPVGKRHDLDVLIAAGHISTCFNVIEYLWQSHRDEYGQLSERVQELFDYAKADWMRLNEDPYWLVDVRKAAGRKEGTLFWTESGAKARQRWKLLKRRKQSA